jgi:hypothetical protein
MGPFRSTYTLPSWVQQWQSPITGGSAPELQQA